MSILTSQERNENIYSKSSEELLPSNVVNKTKPEKKKDYAKYIWIN